jgi:hypothetical protein
MRWIRRQDLGDRFTLPRWASLSRPLLLHRLQSHLSKFPGYNPRMEVLSSKPPITDHLRLRSRRAKLVVFRNQHQCSPCRIEPGVKRRRISQGRTESKRTHQVHGNGRIQDSPLRFIDASTFVPTAPAAESSSNPPRQIKSAAARTLENLLSKVEAESDKKVSNA